MIWLIDLWFFDVLFENRGWIEERESIFNCGIMQGDLYDHESLVKAIKQVDVVISTVGQMQLADQSKIIDAIKEAGNVKVSNSVTNWFSRFAFWISFCFYLQFNISGRVWHHSSLWNKFICSTVTLDTELQISELFSTLVLPDKLFAMNFRDFLIEKTSLNWKQKYHLLHKCLKHNI